MVNFDAADRESLRRARDRTNTPLQALNLMNDVTFVEAARVLAQRMISEGGATADARLRYGFRLATGRAPSAAEAQVLRDGLNYHLRLLRRHATKRDELSRARANRRATRARPRRAGRLAAVASLILNLDETITKE